MATIRELVAKLGFEVDTSGAEKFQNTLKGVRTGLNTLLLGKGLNAASQLEDVFLGAQRKIEFLSGDKGLGALADALNMVSSTASDVDIASAMQAGIEATTDPQFTKQMVEFGGLMADAFGGSLQENTATLIQGAMAGNFASLVSSGLFTQQEAEFLGGTNINTIQGKLTIINKLEEKRAKLIEQRGKALKTQGTQSARLVKNMEDFGRKIGSFLNPIIAFALDKVNDLIEIFIGSPMAMAIAKVIAFAGAMTVVAGVITTMIAAGKVLLLVFSPLLIKIALISAAIVAVGLLIEDAFFSGKDFKDSYLGKGLIWIFDNLTPIGAILNGLGTSLDELLNKDFKETSLGKSLAWAIEKLEEFKNLVSSKAESAQETLTEGSQAAATIGSKAGSFLNQLNPFQGGQTPSPAMAGGGGGNQVIDNRKANISVTVQGGDPVQVQKAVEGAIKNTGMSGKVTAMNQIAARDTKTLGSNGL
jgi:hypothetical protein